MQLLPLLATLLLFCLCVLAQEETSSTRAGRHRSRQWKEKHHLRELGELSQKQKDSIRGHWKVDPEARKARLQRIKHRKNSTLSPEAKAELEERKKQIPEIETEKPNELEPVDLFDVNMKQGVSSYLYQGDIHLTEPQLSAVEDSTSDDSRRSKRQAAKNVNLWTGNTVYYYFDPSLNARKQASVTAAQQYIQSRTCINFVKSETATNRIRVFNGVGCYSNVGMVGGVQDLSLGDGCEVIGTVAHEFTHALGFWHTQMRSDRDNYVTIDLTYVTAGYEGNFALVDATQNIIYNPDKYEYGSFMHYGSNSFTNPSNKLSIVPKDMRYAYTMGNRQISFFDVDMLNQHYGCNKTCPAATSAKCQNGGSPNPRNCATCNCPLGYAGTLCTERPSGCGEALTATTTWQSKAFDLGDSTDNQNVRDVFTMCNHWISAPTDSQIQVRITSMFNPQCQFGCPFNGIEIKGDADQRMTNPRYCCEEFLNQIFNSTLNPTPIISFNRYYLTKFTIEYRYVGADPVTTTTTATTKAPTTAAATTISTTKAPVVTSTSVAPTTTTTTTTKSPIIQSKCKSMNTPENCANNVRAGFCTMSATYSPQTIKFNCAEECGLCGKAATPCVDTNAKCLSMKQNGFCESYDPMTMEYNCAKTCGFCDKPN